MRVALHTDQLWFSAPGGIGTYVAELLRTLPTLDVDVITFQASERGAAATPPDAEVPGSIRRLYPSWDLLAWPGLTGALEACEVVHATNHAAIPPAGKGQGLVATVHDLAFDAFPQLFPAGWRWLYRLGVRAAARRADLIITPSRATADDLTVRYGVDTERIRVTPLASSLPSGEANDEQVLKRLRIPLPYLVCPATLEPRKNQTRLVRAYRQLASELPHALVLAGPDGWHGDELENEIGRRGPGRIIRTGPLRPFDVDVVIRNADALAYPSLYEGFGLPIIEGMARGVPVVTSTTPACAETAGDAAELVDPTDVGGLADALARVLTDGARRDVLVERGHARAAGFTWDATARATLDAYREAVERARA